MKKKETRHKPCNHRRRESINGCAMDMCYAIGFERVGDMPCEYCVDRKRKPKGSVKRHA